MKEVVDNVQHLHNSIKNIAESVNLIATQSYSWSKEFSEEFTTKILIWYHNEDTNHANHNEDINHANHNEGVNHAYMYHNEDVNHAYHNEGVNHANHNEGVNHVIIVFV